VSAIPPNNLIARNAFKIAGLVTLGFFIFVIFLMAGEVCASNLVIFEKCQSRWSYFMAAPPNEIGDALAGVASGLALIWVVASVVIQRLELSSTVDELRASTQIEVKRDALREYVLALEEFSDAFFSLSDPEAIYGEWSYKIPNQENLEQLYIRSRPKNRTEDHENNLGVGCAFILENAALLIDNFELVDTKPARNFHHNKLYLAVVRLDDLADRVPDREASLLKATRVKKVRSSLEKLYEKENAFLEELGPQ